MFFCAFILGSLWADLSHEAFCSSHDSSILEHNMNSSAQQPCSHSKEDVTNNSQEKSPETATNTSQSTLHIDLSQWSTPTPPSESVDISDLKYTRMSKPFNRSPWSLIKQFRFCSTKNFLYMTMRYKCVMPSVRWLCLILMEHHAKQQLISCF